MAIIRSAKCDGRHILTATGEMVAEVESSPFEEILREEREKAFKHGFERGEISGQKKSQEELKMVMDIAEKSASQLLEQKERLLEQLKPELVEFCLKICERIIRKELSAPSSAARLISTLIASTSFRNERKMRVYLSSEQFMAFQEKKDLLKGIKKENVEFLSDPKMHPGDIRIEGKSGIINYDISRELTDLQAKIFQK